MKIFIVRKEEDVGEEKQNIEKVEHIRIEKDEKFNYIIIKNPNDSNKICTVNDIRVWNEDIPNKICLMGGEEELYRAWEKDLDAEKVDMFSVKTKNTLKQIDGNIEIKTNDVLINEECSILQELSIIMLPKGCLFIKLDKEVNVFNMDINWTSEEIS